MYIRKLALIRGLLFSLCSHPGVAVFSLLSSGGCCFLSAPIRGLLFSLCSHPGVAVFSKFAIFTVRLKFPNISVCNIMALCGLSFLCIMTFSFSSFILVCLSYYMQYSYVVLHNSLNALICFIVMSGWCP